MKKMNKKVNNVLYALVYELIFIPLLSYVSYYIYTRLNYIGIINENLIFSSLILIVLVILNLLEGGSGCLEAARYNKLFSIVLIFVVTYNLLYVPLHKITKRKGKKIKLSLK